MAKHASHVHSGIIALVPSHPPTILYPPTPSGRIPWIGFLKPSLIPCLHISLGVQSKQELQRQVGCLPGPPDSVHSSRGSHRALDQHQGRSHLPSGRNQEFHKPEQQLWYFYHTYSNHGYKGNLWIRWKAILASFSRRSRSTWVGAPPWTDVNWVLVGVIVIPPAANRFAINFCFVYKSLLHLTVVKAFQS